MGRLVPTSRQLLSLLPKLVLFVSGSFCCQESKVSKVIRGEPRVEGRDISMWQKNLKFAWEEEVGSDGS